MYTDNIWKPFKSIHVSGLIWIQTIWHIPERFLLKKVWSVRGSEWKKNASESNILTLIKNKLAS